MKQEVSAGGIVATKKDNEWFVLLLRDMNGNWTFPKGIIEQGEDSRVAAEREILEETGVSGLTRIGELPPISYTYTRDGLIQKQVEYFVYTAPTAVSLVPQTEEGISEASWVPLGEALSRLGYPKTNIPLLEEAKRLLSTI